VDAVEPEGSFPQGPPPLQPRLSGVSLAPPFNPGGFFLVAFFCGSFGICYLAITNLSRLTPVPALRQRTIAVAVATVAATIAALFVMPGDWFESRSNIRLILRIVAVVGSGVFFAIQRGPALGRAIGHDEAYTSAWKRALPLIGFSVLQGIVTYIITRSRGLL